MSRFLPGAGERNSLRLIVRGDEGYLYVNGAHFSNLPLNQIVDAGWVAAGSGFDSMTRDIALAGVEIEEFPSLAHPGVAAMT